MPHAELAFAPQAASSFSSAVWDRLGVFLSGLCAMHCLTLPVLLLTLPCEILGAQIHEALHPAMAVFLIPITLRAARQAPGARLLHTGLTLVWLAVPGHAFAGECVGLVLTLAGSAALILGHRANLFCRHEAHTCAAC